MAESKHLLEIMARHNRTANVQVVFADIEKYSRRRSQSQIAVIDAFTAALTAALDDTARTFLSYAQQNNLNFSTDIIRLPTGDGAAIGFTFEGLHDIHLAFAKSLLREAHDQRQKDPCDKFTAAGWCNCHAYFNARIGVSEGKAIIYKDVNGNFNLAGGAVNLASRVMGKIEPNQIGFTESAYDQIVDMVDDPAMSDRFHRYKNVKIKHGELATMFQYLEPEAPYLNSGVCEALSVEEKLDSAMDRLNAGGFMPRVPLAGDRVETGRALLAVFEQVEQAMSLLKGVAQRDTAIEAHAQAIAEKEELER